MPLYRVVCDGTDILDYTSRDLILLAPDLELEINTAGSLEFVMPPYHKYYDIVNILTSTIEVYEDNDMIWFGRPVEQKIDFFKQKKIYCEGPLSFFNDTVQRPQEFDSISLEQFFRHIVLNHNTQVDDSNRTFQVGIYDLGSRTVYRKLDYNSSYDALTSMCLNAEDGYFFFRRENGVNYIDWLKDMPYRCNQPIQFGLNLLNYSSNFDATDFATCVLPVGANDSNTNEPLTIASINNGDDVLISEAASTYGPIIKVNSWSDIKDAVELMAEGQKYLENTQFNALMIECSAADLHSKNSSYEIFKLGQMVHCISNPHLIDRDFPLSKLSLRLDSAAKVITLGIMKRKTLTRIYKNDIDQMQQYEPEPYTPESYDPGVIEDPNGDKWEVIMPEEPGGPVTAVRLPTHITVARMPNKTKYTPGEDLDFTGLLVKIWTKDKDGKESIWTNPPRYLDGQAPMSELSFSTKTAPKISEFSVMVTWKYKGKSYNTTLNLSVSDGLNTMPLHRPIPHAATGEAISQQTEQHYYFENGSGQLTQWFVDKRHCGILGASTSPNTELCCRGSATWKNKTSKKYTYNGKTVFYYWFYSGGTWGSDLTSLSPVCNSGANVPSIPEASAAAAAWIMIYGG